MCVCVCECVCVCVQDCERKVVPKHAVEGIPNDVTFVDGYPFLITSEASLRALNQLLADPVCAPPERATAGVTLVWPLLMHGAAVALSLTLS
jgi:hypothetical protein